MINETNWNVTHFPHESETAENPEENLPLSVTILIILIGTVGNCLVCLAISFNRKLQNVKNYFLFSLAVTDLMVNLLVLPGRMVSVRYKFQPSTFPLCYLYLVGDDFVTAASAVHICFLSLMVYPSLKNPLQEGHLTRRKLVTTIGLVWVIAFLTIVPYMMIAITSKQPHKPMFCPELLANFTYFNAIVLIEALVIITMIVIVFTSFIFTTYQLHKSARNQRENESTDIRGLVGSIEENRNEDLPDHNQGSQVPHVNTEALRITWLVSFAFIVSMGPYACTSLFFIAFPHIIIPPVLLEITGYLSYANSVINPFIYTLFDKAFRDAFKNIMLFKYKRII